MANWTQPLCTHDWLEREGEWEGEELISFSLPIIVKRDEIPWPERLEQCCVCGRATTAGIFVRIDPSTVPYPAPDDEE